VNDTYGNNFTVDIQQMPKENDISTTYPQSEWPFYVRQGNCTPANVYQGLAIVWTTTSVRRRYAATGPCPMARCSIPRTSTLRRAWASPTSDIQTVIRTGYGILQPGVGNAYFDMARNIAGRVP